jgi:hypothetical protein
VVLTAAEVANPELRMGGGTYYGYSGYQAWRGLATDASGNATLWLFQTRAGQGYTLTATPPLGSGFGATNLAGVELTGDRAVSITLAAEVTLQVRVLDGEGNGVPDQTLELAPVGGAPIHRSTDAAGTIAFSVTPGDYRVQIWGSTSTGASPSNYYLAEADSIHVSGDTTLDLRLPVKRLDVRVQDPAGHPVGGVVLTAAEVANPELRMGGGTYYGYSGYQAGRGLATDASGNATLWLFQTRAGQGYTVTATPPAGLPFGPVNVNDVALISDRAIVILLQFAHAPPVTTAALAPAPVDGKYPDPTTVTLSATAASGHGVAATKYRLDGGAEASYTAPLAVHGVGGHTLEYWSVDDAGVYESPRQVTFEIAAVDRTPPVITPVRAGTVGSAGWFVSDVSVSWKLEDAESAVGATSGCEAALVNADTPGRTFTCTGTSAGGTASASVTVKRDATAPSIAFSGNRGSYMVDQRVTITCVATDATSGVASSTCPGVDAGAYTLSIGAHTLSAHALDFAGNAASAAATFTVAVSHASLCVLVARFSTKPGVTVSLCAKLVAARIALQRGDTRAYDNLMGAFMNEVEAQTRKSIAPSDAEVLLRLGRAL